MSQLWSSQHGLGVRHLIPQDKGGENNSPRDAELNFQENMKHMSRHTPLKMPHWSQAKCCLEKAEVATSSWNERHGTNIFQSMSFRFYIFPSFRLPWLLMRKVLEGNFRVVYYDEQTLTCPCDPCFLEFTSLDNSFSLSVTGTGDLLQPIGCGKTTKMAFPDSFPFCETSCGQQTRSRILHSLVAWRNQTSTGSCKKWITPRELGSKSPTEPSDENSAQGDTFITDLEDPEKLWLPGSSWPTGTVPEIVNVCCFKSLSF